MKYYYEIFFGFYFTGFFWFLSFLFFKYFFSFFYKIAWRVFRIIWKCYSHLLVKFLSSKRLKRLVKNKKNKEIFKVNIFLLFLLKIFSKRGKFSLRKNIDYEKEVWNLNKNYINITWEQFVSTCNEKSLMTS